MTSSSTLNNSGERGHPWLAPDLRGNAFSFCPLSMLAEGFSYTVFIMLRYHPSILTLMKGFIINGCWILSSDFSVAIDMIMWFSSFFFKRFYLLIFRERGREKERGKNHQWGVASHTPPTGDLAHNPGMCPAWEMNQWPFGSQVGTEPH